MRSLQLGQSAHRRLERRVRPLQLGLGRTQAVRHLHATLRRRRVRRLLALLCDHPTRSVKEVELPLQDLISKEISLIGTYGFGLKAFEKAVQILPQFQDELQTFIEGHCTLEETPAVMTALAKGEKQALKIVIDF